MGTLFHSLVGKVKSSTPARKAMKNILIKRGHVQNKNKAPEVNQFKMVGHELREEKYMSGKQRRNKKNKVPSGIWRWVCLPSAEADALLFLEKKRGVESLASPRGLPSTQPLSGRLNSTQVGSRSSYTSTYLYSTNTMPVTVTGLHLVVFYKRQKTFGFSLLIRSQF